MQISKHSFSFKNNFVFLFSNSVRLDKVFRSYLKNNFCVHLFLFFKENYQQRIMKIHEYLKFLKCHINEVIVLFNFIFKTDSFSIFRFKISYFF